MASKVSGGSEVMKALGDLRGKYSAALPSVGEAGVVKRLIMSSPRMNYLFGGGFPIGRIVELYGSESGGKSVISSYIGGQFQNRPDSNQKTVVYIDMEATFDKHYAEVAGLDTSDDKFIIVRPLHGEEAFTIAEGLIKTGEVALIIWDSTTSTPTAAAMEDEFGKRSFGGGGLLFSEGLKKINPYISRFQTSMILLTQMRAKVGFQSYGPPDTPSGGGYAPRFYASWRGRVSKGEEILDGKEVIGNQIKIKNSKSKIGFPKRSGEFDLFYSTGFNPDAEYVDFIIQLGMVKKAGAWLSKEEWGFKGQGTNSLLNFLKDHKDIFEAAKAEVNATFSTFSVIDEAESDDEEEDEGQGPVIAAPASSEDELFN